MDVTRGGVCVKAEEHPSYKEEKNKLEETKLWLDERITSLSKEYEEINEKLLKTRKEVKSVFDERLILQNQLKSSTEKNLKRYKESKNRPYFGRVDFLEDGEKDLKKIYIGKFGLSSDNSDEPVVVDWRAPIADIYYSGESGNASYISPAGEVSGEIMLKRRYDIDEGKLINIFDEKLKEMILQDEFLTSALEKSVDNRLKDIVATIQKEQNDIIRAPKENALIIQGVAGSGKTTIALHRMAYLIYQQQRHNGDGGHYMVIAPNKLFLNYISDILPDLGADDVVQTTFEDYAIKIIGSKVKLRDDNDKISHLLSDKSLQEKRNLIMVSKFKSSILFKKIIDNYLTLILREYVPDTDLMMDGKVLICSKELKELFLNNNVHLPLLKRKSKFADYLKSRINKQKSMFIDEIEKRYAQKIQEIKDKMEDGDERRKKIIELYDMRDEEIKKIPDKINDILKKYFDTWKELKTIDVYKRLFDVNMIKKLSGNKLENDKIEYICNYSNEILNNNEIENEDLAPLIYIDKFLNGLEDYGKYSHIVVDEAQDFSEFKLLILKELAIGDSMTIVGDMAQGIYSYRGIRSWKDAADRIFGGKCSFKILKKSYRSTVEIMEFANKIMEKSKNRDVQMSEPILRHGSVPEVIRRKDLKEIIDDIANILENTGGYTTAIICKTQDFAETVYKKLKRQVGDIVLINEKTEVYKGKKIVIPSYLSKGLEFDSVIIPDANTYGNTELELKLFYVAVTRPLHMLKIYYTDTGTVLLSISS